MKKPLLSFLTLLSTLGAPSFAQTHDYPLAQHLSTYFLGAQRSGDNKSWLHGASHTKDGEAVGLDLSGGWYDCGDYIKFHHTGAYAAMMYLYGYYSFPEAYPDNYSSDFSAPPANGIPDILDEVKIQTDYLVRCANDGVTIYYQVGGMANHQEDHASFSEPVSNSTEKLYNNNTSSVRPCRSTKNGHSNALGNASAALSLMYMSVKNSDPTHANKCLTAAQQYYTVAKKTPKSTADYDNLAYSWLSSTQYHDELALAAVMLYKATNNTTYLNEAVSYASGNNMDNYGWFTYGNVAQLVNLELYKIYKNSNPSTATTYLNRVKGVVNGYATASCGYLHLTNWGSLREASAAAMLACLYHLHTGDAAAYTFAKKNIDYILGSHTANGNIPNKYSFLIGYNVMGGGYPKNPHHAAAFGYATNESPWTKYSQEAANPALNLHRYELKGALAGGPEVSCNNFYDKIDNYVSSEYCMYYNTGFTGAVAYINKIENNIVTKTDTRNQATLSLLVTPNPASNELTINTLEPLFIEFVDQLGVLVGTMEIDNSTKIDISSFQNGVYFIKSTSKSGQYFVNKFIKE